MFELMPDLSFQVKAIAALVALLLAGNAVRAQLKHKRRLPLPPGPPGHWLFGNAIPRAKCVHLIGLMALINSITSQSQQFAAWINQYGPVISLRIGPKIMVIIGRHKVRVNNAAENRVFKPKFDDRNQSTSWKKRVGCWQTAPARLQPAKFCHVDYV